MAEVSNPQRESELIDSHVHVFPQDVNSRREQLIQSDRWFEELYSNPDASLASTDTLLASMEAAGVSRSILCGFPWSDPGLCRHHNDYMADSRKHHPARLDWLATVVPHDGHAAAEAERAFAQGAVGVGELNADGQGFLFEEPDGMSDLVDVCQAWNRPIMFHVSEPVGHAYPGKGTATPDKLLVFLQRFPGVQVIAAHWGGGLPFYEMMPEVSALTRNVVYDSAATTYLYRFPVFPTVISLVGSRRVLFASDYPVLRQDRLVKRVRGLAMADDTWRLVTCENARRVFQLEKG